jgi:hypothetical protein
MDSVESLANLTLGGLFLGFDRSGAWASLLVGVVRMLRGLAVLLP